MVYRSVKKQYQKSQKYAFSEKLIQTSLSVLKEASVQSVCYTVVYINSALWVGLAAQVGDNLKSPTAHYGEVWLFVIQLFPRIFSPLQGFLNFLVFARSGAKRWLKAYPDRNVVWALWQVIFKDVPPSDQVLMRLAHPASGDFAVEEHNRSKLSSRFDTRSSSLFMSTSTIQKQNGGNGDDSVQVNHEGLEKECSDKNVPKRRAQRRLAALQYIRATLAMKDYCATVALLDVGAEHYRELLELDEQDDTESTSRDDSGDDDLQIALAMIEEATNT